MDQPDVATDPVIGHRDYEPADWPDVEVLVDETYHAGELRGWTQRRLSGWWGHVQYPGGPAQTYLYSISADRIRAFQLNDELRGVLVFTRRTFPDDAARDQALHEELQISPARYGHQVAWLRRYGHLDAASND